MSLVHKAKAFLGRQAMNRSLRAPSIYKSKATAPYRALFMTCDECFMSASSLWEEWMNI